MNSSPRRRHESACRSCLHRRRPRRGARARRRRRLRVRALPEALTEGRLSPRRVRPNHEAKREDKPRAITQSRPALRRRTLRVSMEPAAAAASSSSSTSSPAGAGAARRTLPEAAELKLRRKTLESVLEQCQRVPELMCEDDLGIAVLEEAAEAADRRRRRGRTGAAWLPAMAAMRRARSHRRRRMQTMRRTSSVILN